MKNNYSQENQKVIGKINRTFLENNLLMVVYLFLFRIANGKFPGEQKFFIHLTEDQNFTSALLFAFSLITLCIFFFSAAVYLTKRILLKKYRYVKDNLLFLNNQWVTTLNCILRICGYAMLTISFMSLQRLLLTFFFITLFSSLEKERDFNSQLNPGFFSWRDTKLRRLFTYSLTLAILFPICNTLSITGFIQRSSDIISRKSYEIKKSFPPEAQKEINGILQNIPFGSLFLFTQKILLSVLSSKEIKGGFFIIILFIFVRNTIKESILSFENFWREIATTAKRVEWFRLFSNFQLAAKNKKVKIFAQGLNGFPVLCYESFALNPNFIRESYIENLNNFDKSFVEKIESVNKLVELVNNKVNKIEEKNFIFYWIFNHVNSFQAFSLYNESIRKTNDAYSKQRAM